MSIVKYHECHYVTVLEMYAKHQQHRSKGEKLTVRHLSLEVSGKAQKYTRISLHEFVPFNNTEMTIGNVTSAHEKYFIMVNVTYTCQNPTH